MFERVVLPKKMRWSATQWAAVGPRFAAILFGIALFATAWNFVSTSFDRDRVEAQNAAIMSLEHLLTETLDIQTSMRGFALVGSEAFLEPYQNSVSYLSETLAAARQTWKDSDGTEASIATLLGLVERSLAFATRVVEARRRGFDEALALVASGEGKVATDAIRIEVARLQTEAVGRREILRGQDRLRSLALTILSLAAALSAISYLGWLAWYRRKVEMRTSEELVGLGDRFRTLADNIPQLAWMADPAGRILLVQSALVRLHRPLAG